jgi:hypothetical protein
MCGASDWVPDKSSAASRGGKPAKVTAESEFAVFRIGGHRIACL